MKHNKIWFSLLMGGALLATPACVDVDVDDALEYKDAYNDVNDADKAILGIYSQFMDLSKQMVVLNELRGDLMDITNNATMDLQQVDAKAQASGNPYLSPVGYYKIITNCNDCLDNFNKMRERHDMTEDEYNERYSDVAAMRCYVYLQLAAQFGPKIPYVTDPVVTVTDMLNGKGVEMLSLGEILPRLIATMEQVPTLKPYEQSPLVTTLDGNNLAFYFVNKQLLLADLYLWNNQYFEAASLYRDFLTYKETDETSNLYYYKCSSTTTNSGTPDAYQAYYKRYFDADNNSFESTWPKMFEDKLSTKQAGYEWIWTITFNAGKEPAYPFVDLFASTAEGGSYQLRPSSSCIANFMDPAVSRTNGSPYDTRGENVTFKTAANGDTVCAKYLYQYDPSLPHEQEGRWSLYRAGTLHLRFAEALNRYGYPEIALALVNEGLTGHFGMNYPKADKDGKATNRNSDPRNFDTPNIFQILYPVATGYSRHGEKDSTLITFDTRYVDASANAFENIRRRGAWRANAGLREGRAVMSKKYSSAYSDKKLSECATLQDSIYLVEKIIMDEAALELAHEGSRFPDLVRVAHRMNVDGNDGMNGDAYFQKVMDSKYHNPGHHNVVGTPDYSAGETSWFLPYNE